NVDKSDLTPEFREKIEGFDTQLAQKVTKGNVTVADINKNKGKLDQTYLSDELLQQMAGNTPINAVPADGSIDNKKLDSVVYGKILNSGTDANLLDVPGFYTVTTGGNSTEELNFPPWK